MWMEPYELKLTSSYEKEITTRSGKRVFKNLKADREQTKRNFFMNFTSVSKGTEVSV